MARGADSKPWHTCKTVIYLILQHNDSAWYIGGHQEVSHFGHENRPLRSGSDATEGVRTGGKGTNEWLVWSYQRWISGTGMLRRWQRSRDAWKRGRSRVAPQFKLIAGAQAAVAVVAIGVEVGHEAPRIRTAVQRTATTHAIPAAAHRLKVKQFQHVPNGDAGAEGSVVNSGHGSRSVVGVLPRRLLAAEEGTAFVALLEGRVRAR